MNNNNTLHNIKSLEKTHLCFHCNEINPKITYLKICNRNCDDCNTIFDGDNITIQLCPDCIKKLSINLDHFDNALAYDPISDSFLGELYILDLIDSFCIHNQELCYNSNNTLDNRQSIDTEDWIQFHEPNSLYSNKILSFI
ncbi:MAG: hypothetical protein RR942_01480 [Romboutsia sp.]